MYSALIKNSLTVEASPLLSKIGCLSLPTSFKEGIAAALAAHNQKDAKKIFEVAQLTDGNKATIIGYDNKDYNVDVWNTWKKWCG